MGKIDLGQRRSNKRNGNPPRVWSNTSKIRFATIYDTLEHGGGGVFYAKL